LKTPSTALPLRFREMKLSTESGLEFLSLEPPLEERYRYTNVRQRDGT